MRPTDNVIEEVWLAYALDPPEPEERLRARLARVEAHFGGLYADPLERAQSLGERHGLALWRRPDERLRWPLWAMEGPLAAGFTAVPTGWGRVVDELDPSAAAIALARAIEADPARIAELNPPFVLGARDSERDSLTIVNDAVGAGRLYELALPEGGRVWSNRLAALPLFAGVAPAADERSWRVFAAAGWFLGETTPIEGARKVPPTSSISVRVAGERTLVERTDTGVRARLVTPRRARLGESAQEAAAAATGIAADFGRAWDAPIEISLSGGRDSRISAAAAVAAGIDATFSTTDQDPGEVEVVRELIGAAPVPMRHEIVHPEPEEPPEGGFAERVRDIHLVHDGLRNPQEVRRPTEIPHSMRLAPTLSGHGGELGHGFYYGRRRKLRRIRRGRERGPITQLERNARRKHSAAVPEAYDEYLAECEATLAEGRAAGLEGPELLDWYYLAQRLPYRSGLGARSGRASACVTPAFVRGAFDLSPRQRLGAKLHRPVIAAAVPEWKDVRFFTGASGAMPEIRRRRIWERPDEAAVVAEMIASERAWPAMLRPDAIRAMWDEVRAGGGSRDWEHVFDRLVWRVTFEDHLALIGRRARA
jgi:hypothetical protein